MSVYSTPHRLQSTVPTTCNTRKMILLYIFPISCYCNSLDITFNPDNPCDPAVPVDVTCPIPITHSHYSFTVFPWSLYSIPLFPILPWSLNSHDPLYSHDQSTDVNRAMSTVYWYFRAFVGEGFYISISIFIRFFSIEKNPFAVAISYSWP